MEGFGLCLWRLGRFDESGVIFDGILWLNPSDNQGVRFLLNDVRSRKPREDRSEDGGGDSSLGLADYVVVEHQLVRTVLTRRGRRLPSPTASMIAS